MSKKDKHNTIRDLLLYLRGKLSGKEKNRIERDMQKDPFEAEAMEGFDSFDPDEVEEDLLEINSRLNKRMKRKNRFILYRIAASIAVIIALSVTYFLISDREIKELPVNPEISESLELPEETVIEEKQDPEEDKPEKELEKPDKEEFPEEKPVRESTEPPVTKKDRVVKRPELDMSEIGDEIVRVEESEDVKGEIKPGEVVEITAAPEAAEPVRMAVEDQFGQAKKETLSEDNYRHRAMAAKKSLTPELQSAGKKEGLISGVVLSAEDSMPLPGATVWLEGTDIGTATDKQGRFEIKPTGDGPDKLNVSFIGMEPVKKSVGSDADLEIMMKPNSLALEEVVIVKQGKTAHELTGGVSRIENADGTPDTPYQEAYPLGGKKEFKEYIEENIIYPDTTTSDREVVVLKFIVLPDGRPSNIKVILSPGEKFSKEAIRLLINGPDWIPAEKGGKYIAEENRLKVIFQK